MADMLHPLVREARAFAVRAHGRQKYGDEPYSVHLDEVAEVTRGVEDSPLALAVAYLHDVLEDTAVEPEELESAFCSHGPGLARDLCEAVMAVTDPEAPSRRTRKDKLHARLAGLDHKIECARVALLVKTADRVANVRSCVRDGKDGLLGMYRKEHVDFRDAVRREGLAEGLWEELEKSLA